MVIVALLEQPQNELAEIPAAEPTTRQGKRYLKVDQVGAAVVADDDVFALVEIDVGDAVGVHVPQQRLKRGEKTIGHPFARRQRMTGNVLVGHRVRQASSIGADRAQQTGNVSGVFQSAQDRASRRASSRPNQRMGIPKIGCWRLNLQTICPTAPR